MTISRSELIMLNKRLKADGLRYCAACDQTLPLTEFPVNRGARCRACSYQHRMAYMRSLPEEKRAEYRRKNTEYCREYQRRDAVAKRARNRRWRAENPDKVREYSRRYKAANADLIRERKRLSRQRQREARQAAIETRKVTIAAISAECAALRQRQRDLQAIADAHERALERRAMRRAG